MFAAPDEWQPASPPHNPVAPPGLAQPPAAPVVPTSAPEEKCELFVIGDEHQCVQVCVPPGRTIRGRKGSLVFRGGLIEERAETALLQLIMPADGIQLCTWLNSGVLPAYVAFSGKSFGKILNLDIGKAGPMLLSSECLLCVTGENTIEARPRQIPEERGGNGGSGKQAGVQLHHVRGRVIVFSR